MPVVVIKSPRYIPGLGQGPINEPTYISDEMYRQLVMQNFLVLKLPEKSVYFEDAVATEDKPKEVEESPVKEEEPAEEIKVEQPKVEDTEEVEPESVKEPEEEKDLVMIHGEEYDLAPMTKNELKKLLDENEVTYMYKDNRKRLIEKVKNEIAD